MSITVTYEIVGFSVRLFRAGSLIDAGEMDGMYNDMVLTLAGKRSYVNDVAESVEGDSWKAEGSSWKFEEDAIGVSRIVFIGNTGCETVSGNISASVNHVGLENTFDGYWEEIAAIAISAIALSNRGEASFATLWKHSSIWSPGTRYRAEEYDEEQEILGVLDMDKLKLALEVAA